MAAFVFPTTPDVVETAQVLPGEMMAHIGPKSRTVSTIRSDLTSATPEEYPIMRADWVAALALDGMSSDEAGEFLTSLGFGPMPTRLRRAA